MFYTRECDASEVSKPESRDLYHPSQLALTDLGNAQRFAELFARTVRYVPTRGWHHFSETHWQPVNTEKMVSLVRHSLVVFEERTSQIIDEDMELYGRIRKHLARCESLARLKAILSLVRTLPGIQLSYAALDADPFFLNMRNGTFDLRSGELLPHNPEHYLTRLLPYDYRHELTSPEWDDFMDRLTGSDTDLKIYLQRMVGATLFGASNESTCFVLTGSGQRAQKLFLSILRQLLGSYSTNILSLNERKLTATVLNARLLTSTSSALVRAFDPVILSAFLNHEPLTVIKASTELVYQPRPALWLSASELPQFSEDLAFLREYLQPIPLSLSLSSHESAQLAIQFQMALPAILNWAIEGFQIWYTEAPCEPLCIQQATAVFHEDQEPLALFLAQTCIAEQDAMISVDELYWAYLAWAHLSGERALTASRFGVRALASGLEISGQASTCSYLHIKFLAPLASSFQLGERVGRCQADSVSA